MNDAGAVPASSRMRGPLAALAAAAAGAVYVLAVRPRILRWGASTQEAAGPLPGDEMVTAPRMQSTRAVTIAAPVADVWPWLVQLGAGRGGLYSYDWLENAAGLDIHSADRIIPELQQLRVGDVVPLTPDVGLAVRVLQPGEVLAMGGTIDARAGGMAPDGVISTGPRVEVGWTFVLRPAGAHATRLVSRTRYDYSPLAAGLVLRPLLEPVQFVMERRMLLGIRARAERSARGHDTGHRKRRGA
ncbi:SRPBCC family protein [Arthrobacter sp. PM3]|uniref:SRPBCC family protein n=1 Tax=Arthrobacter sp. PM3 TaxID=2017685 RepID=UPI001C9B0EFC|nr:SRPBCC family protein [Arthrobacter sp. PM3]